MTYLVKGSLQEITQASGRSLAETFLNVDAIVLVDMSGSMAANDAPGGLSRYKMAESELAKLQNELPGKIAVIAFSSFALFCPTGKPERLGASTDMVEALNFVKIADDTGIRFIMVSDGYPNDSEDTLRIARTFKSKIDTVFIGPEGVSNGRDFLERLAQATGGQFYKSKEIGLLAEPIKLLLGM